MRHAALDHWRNLVDINAVIREALSLAGLRLAEAQVALETALDGALPSIRGDRIELQQVTQNLVTNAVDAMAPIERQANVTRT